MKILFFAESLQTGGKERRLLELIQYLTQQTNYEIALVLTENEIHYKYVFNLKITIKIINRKRLIYDPSVFIRFYKFCSDFKPDVIHTWGRMTTFYALPAKFRFKVPLISNLISDTKRKFKTFSFDSLFFNSCILFSDIILSNSKAGLLAYNVTSPKARVIYNGVNIKRFSTSIDIKKKRSELGINTNFMVIMVASFSKNKDYNLFLDIAKNLGCIRDDVTFIGVGDGTELIPIQQRIKNEQITNVLLTGQRIDIEQIVACSDIGILCTYTEGISNAIIEYMAMGKPVIATDLEGGSRELIIEGKTGYCTDSKIEEVVSLISVLLNNANLRRVLGTNGKERINTYFSVERMGNDFEAVYEKVIGTADRYEKNTIQNNRHV